MSAVDVLWWSAVTVLTVVLVGKVVLWWQRVCDAQREQVEAALASREPVFRESHSLPVYFGDEPELPWIGDASAVDR